MKSQVFSGKLYGGGRFEHEMKQIAQVTDSEECDAALVALNIPLGKKKQSTAWQSQYYGQNVMT